MILFFVYCAEWKAQVFNAGNHIDSGLDNNQNRVRASMQGTTDALAVGDGRYVDINLEVTAQDGVTKKVYTVKVARLPSPVSTLESLTVDSVGGMDGFRICGNEGEVCSCTGSVIYSQTFDGTGSGTANSLSDVLQHDYRERAVSGSILCEAASFLDGSSMRGDPATGQTKSCFCLEQLPLAPTPTPQSVSPAPPPISSPSPTPMVATTPGRQTYTVAVANTIRSVRVTPRLTRIIDQDGTLSPGTFARPTISYGRRKWTVTPTPAPPGVTHDHSSSISCYQHRLIWRFVDNAFTIQLYSSLSVV